MCAYFCVCLCLICDYLSAYCVIWISSCYALVVGGCLVLFVGFGYRAVQFEFDWLFGMVVLLVVGLGCFCWVGLAVCFVCFVWFGICYLF